MTSNPRQMLGLTALLCAFVCADAVAKAKRPAAAPAAAPAAIAPAAPKPKVSLAKCLGEHGMIFYGASWCPYCAQQKRLFGADAKDLPYVECSADGARRGPSTPACEKADVDTYPSWLFPDGVPHVGVRLPEELAAISGCD